MKIEVELIQLQKETFDFFLHETNPVNGLVVDKTAANWPASIAATGLALACYPVSVERGFMTRAAAAERLIPALEQRSNGGARKSAQRHQEANVLSTSPR